MGDELEILKGKRGKPAAAVGVERRDEVEAVNAKLAGNAAVERETQTLNLLKTKAMERGGSATSTPTDHELEILKAKRGKGSVDSQRPDEVGALKAKLAGSPAATEGETTTRTALETKLAARPGPPQALRREAAGHASGNATANERVTPPRRSAFDLAFALVVALWALAVALALTTGAEWWFFSFCVVVTLAVALFGVLGSTGFRHQN